MSVDFLEESADDFQIQMKHSRKKTFSEKLRDEFHLDKTAIRAIAISSIILFIFCSAVFAAVGLSKQRELQNARQDFINRFSPPQDVKTNSQN